MNKGFDMTNMTNKEIEDLAELIAIKVSDRYFEFTKEYVATQVKLHTFQCAAGKFAWLKSLASAITGGIIVGIVMWFVNKP